MKVKLRKKDGSIALQKREDNYTRKAEYICPVCNYKSYIYLAKKDSIEIISTCPKCQSNTIFEKTHKVNPETFTFHFTQKIV